MKQPPNRLREIRARKGISGNRLAEVLGISPQYYYNLEKGNKRLNEDHIRALSAYLNVSANDILGLPGPNEDDLPALDSWKQAPNFGDAILVLVDIQIAHGLPDEWFGKMVKEAKEYFNFEVGAGAPPDLKAAHVSGPAAQGGSGIFDDDEGSGGKGRKRQ